MPARQAPKADAKADKPTSSPVTIALREDAARRVAPAAGPQKPAKYADDDNSIDARMWRLEQDHIRMGARPKR